MQSDLALRMNTYLLSPGMFASGIATVVREANRLRPTLLHAHWLLPNGFIAAVASRRLGIPLVISAPGSDVQVAGKNPLFRAMARFALRQARLLTANSAELRDAVLQIGAAKPEDKAALAGKFDLIIYGTDPNALKPDATGVAELRARLQLSTEAAAGHPIPPSPDHPTILLCVGRMVPKKGFDVLLRAMAEPVLRRRNVTAVMVGGNVPKNEIRVYYNLADILVNPSVSRPADGLNVCVLDAMSCGKAVVGSTVAGNPLAIVAGETGLIVPEQDPSALAQALACLVDDPALRLRMGAEGRRRIENELGWPHLARRYLQHFSEIIR
jgi:glycosyltransferase involved in cell wall biosynthesis